MCVIIVKPAGVEMPSASELYKAHRFNPHGMGFVSPSVKYKGLSFDAFYKKLKLVPIDEPCIIHFRFATHGSIKRSNCHPFNIGDVYFAHNGILNIQPKGDMTDSETAFKEYLYPEIKQHGLESPQVSLIIKALIGHSKFAFMKNGRVSLFGDFKLHNGLYYSNLRHLENYRWAI